MSIVAKLLNRKEFQEQPPVLIDIGASGELNPRWKELASKSICIAFDADQREFSFIEKEDSHFKKLYVFHCIVSDKEKSSGKDTFYLTSSPYCSSLLESDIEKLKDWVFVDLFHIQKTVELPVRSLSSVLRELSLDYIDWFKTDSQGIDLRLFKSLGTEIISKVIIAEFEPGIIDAYKGEDKLYSVIEYMDKNPFWMDDIVIKGTQRISNLTVKTELPFLNYYNGHKYLKTSPCWAEVSFINDFTNTKFSVRDYLLGIVISLIKEQKGFALDLACKAESLFPNEKIFSEVKEEIKSQIVSVDQEIKNTSEIVKTTKTLPIDFFSRIKRKLMRILQ